jgi:hypothetical protein
MIASKMRYVARMRYVFFYGISVGKPERVRLEDTGVDGRIIKPIFKHGWADVD